MFAGTTASETQCGFHFSRVGRLGCWWKGSRKLIGNVTRELQIVCCICFPRNYWKYKFWDNEGFKKESNELNEAIHENWKVSHWGQTCFCFSCLFWKLSSLLRFYRAANCFFLTVSHKEVLKACIIVPRLKGLSAVFCAFVLYFRHT